MFDAVVISGEVGMRKPEARIFEHTLELLGLPAAECVFVDDLPHNVAAAAGLGLVGVQHVSYGPGAARARGAAGPRPELTRAPRSRCCENAGRHCENSRSRPARV